MSIEPTGYIDVTIRIEKADGQYAAECLELGVASCGDDLDEALERILDATVAYLNDLEETGEIEAVFRERGIVIHPGPSEVVFVPARRGEIVYSYQQEIPPRPAVVA